MLETTWFCLLVVLVICSKPHSPVRWEIAKSMVDVVSIKAKICILLIKLLNFHRSLAGFLLGRVKLRRCTNSVTCEKKKNSYLSYIAQDSSRSDQSSRGIVPSTLLSINQDGSIVKLFPIQEQNCFGQNLFIGPMGTTFLIWNLCLFLTDRCLWGRLRKVMKGISTAQLSILEGLRYRTLRLKLQVRRTVVYNFSL